MDDTSFWRKCSTCKKPIPFGSTYYVCNVSTCNGQRTGYVFCSVGCFDAHIPGARHKDAYAIESQAPAKGSAATVAAPSAAREPARLIVKSPQSQAAPTATNSGGEVLVIASRLKDYIQSRSGFNTSASVMDVLSDHLRIITDRAIEVARSEGRKTVMDRDFQFLKSK